MECVHHPVAPTVLAFLVVLCGTGTLERARAQSTGKLKGENNFLWSNVSLRKKRHKASVIYMLSLIHI